MTPSEIIAAFQPVSLVSVPHPISWADEERDLSAWLGNELQDEAYTKLYELAWPMKDVDDPALRKDWNYLQSSDHFYYMCTKFFSDGEVHRRFNPFESPYEAFINYMNVLNDFKIRVLHFVEANKPEVKTLKPEIDPGSDQTKKSVGRSVKKIVAPAFNKKSKR